MDERSRATATALRVRLRESLERDGFPRVDRVRALLWLSLEREEWRDHLRMWWRVVLW